MTSSNLQSEKIRAVFLSMLVVGSVLATTIAFAGTGLAASGNDPRVGIDSPADGGDLDSQPVISGSATDGSGIASVSLRIKDSNGDSWDSDSESFTSSETWVQVSTDSEWSYDAYNNGISADGVYTVTARATSVDGATQTVAFEELNPDPTEVTYEVDTQAPGLTNVVVTDANDNDDTVFGGDTVEVSADVTDTGSGIASVTADGSVLGGPESLSLTDGDGDGTYTATFDVDDPQMGEGDTSITVTATDDFGQSRTASDGITLDTYGVDADSLSVDHEFVGIVEGPDMLAVSASGVVDDQGYKVDKGQAKVTVAGKTYLVDVVNGGVDDTIDPTAISNTAATGQTTISLGSASDKIRLTHEVNGLDRGYQVGGTPMPADNVVVSESVSDVTAYQPTEESWDQANELRGGEGYYIHADTSDARIGYTFDEDAEKESDSKLLEEGYNLVGASPNMNDKEQIDVTKDLGADLDVAGDADVTARLPDPNTDIEDKQGLDAFEDSSVATDEAEAFEAYWVKIDSDGDYIRTTVEVAYDPSDQ